MIKATTIKQFKADKEKLWSLLTDNSNYFWRRDLSHLDVVDELHFIEYTKNDYPTYFTITSKIKFKEYKFDIQNTMIKGTWVGLITELPNQKIEVSFTEEIEVTGFVMKLLGKIYLKQQQHKYIQDLQKILFQ